MLFKQFASYKSVFFSFLLFRLKKRFNYIPEVTCHLLRCIFIIFYVKLSYGHPTTKVDKTGVFWDRPFP